MFGKIPNTKFICANSLPPGFPLCNLRSPLPPLLRITERAPIGRLRPPRVPVITRLRTVLPVTLRWSSGSLGGGEVMKQRHTKKLKNSSTRKSFVCIGTTSEKRGREGGSKGDMPEKAQQIRDNKKTKATYPSNVYAPPRIVAPPGLFA